MRKSVQGAWKTQNFRVRLIKTCGIVAIIVVFCRFLTGPTTSRHSAEFSSGYDLANPLTTQCSRPYDATKPIIQYTVIIDAGSTGSRVHVYKFNNCGPTPELEKEYFKMTAKRPEGSGLSAYTDPEEAAKSLDPLIQFTRSCVPQKHQSCTPIAVKATAGLRLLGDELSAQILKAVRTRLQIQFPYPVADVEIMTGEDEGVFAWITANYLLGRIGGPNGKPTAAIIDLGGGSSQIVFQPDFGLSGGERGVRAASIPDNYKYDLEFRGKDFHLYQHSHLGYGLMSAREALHRLVLDHAYKQTILSKSWLSRPVPNPCLPPGSRIKITVEMPSDHALAGENDIIMEGPVDVDPTHCQALAEAILHKNQPCAEAPCSINGVYQPSLKETFSEEVYIFSYFYDRTHPLGIPDSFTLLELYELTSKVCAGEEMWLLAFGHLEGVLQSLREMPEWCLDLSFMFTLLHKGYVMPTSRKLNIANQIKGTEIGWCLGASLPLLESASHWQCTMAEHF